MEPSIQLVGIHLQRNPVVGAATQEAPNIFVGESFQSKLFVLDNMHEFETAAGS